MAFPLSHGENRGSSPLGSANLSKNLIFPTEDGVPVVSREAAPRVQPSAAAFRPVPFLSLSPTGIQRHSTHQSSKSSRPSHAVGVIRQSPVSGRKAPELRGFAQSNFVRRPKIRHFRATQCANGASVSGRTFQMSGLCRTIPKRFRRATISNSEMPGGSLGISPPHSATPGSDPK